MKIIFAPFSTVFECQVKYPEINLGGNTNDLS
jgi:hypothetical protein